jgi:hypothetical protein
MLLTCDWLEPQSGAGDGDDLVLDPAGPSWSAHHQVASELFAGRASVALVALVAKPERLRHEMHAATKATKATKADLCGSRPRYLRPKRHYVAIHLVTGRPAVFSLTTRPAAGPKRESPDGVDQARCRCCFSGRATCSSPFLPHHLGDLPQTRWPSPPSCHRSDRQMLLGP